MNRTNLGRYGERLAEEYLQQQGYQIIARNFRLGRHGEIDLVALDGETLVFVEVKIRRTPKFGSPEDAVTHAKRYQLRRIAEGFLHCTMVEATAYRFDVIAIELHGAAPSIRHWKNAFW